MNMNLWNIKVNINEIIKLLFFPNFRPQCMCYIMIESGIRINSGTILWKIYFNDMIHIWW